MCGIAGIIDPQGADLIEKMADAIMHRGPDDAGYFSDEEVSLGMRRLSIIDLAGGHQPIESRDGRYLIFFNGEIYNYREIKKDLSDYEFKTESDTEVVLAGYIKWGEKVLGRLRGMFAIAIYDKEGKKLFLARDFFGIKPLYYLLAPERIPSPALGHRGEVAIDSIRSGLLAFSSEIKSFLALPGFRPQVNDAAVFNYLSYQYNPLGETFFKGVYKLPPAHFMNVDLASGDVEIKKYWQFKFKRNENMSEEEAKRKILKVMEDSVAHHMIADVPVGSFLSGGIDSSIIATLMQKVRGESKIKTFTVGFDTLSEGVESRETAEPLGTDHVEISVSRQEYFEALPKAVWHFDEPVADPSALGLYFLAREARKSVKVVLSGEGADELFGGYNIYLEPFARRWIAWIPKPLLALVANFPLRFRGQNFAKRAIASLEERYIGNASVFTPSEAKELWRGDSEVSYSLESLYREVKDESDSTKMQHIDIHTWLVGDILAKADKMTMAHSLELRVPFLDKEVAEVACKLPDTFKWRGGVSKYMLREAFKNILPESTRTRRKLGFPTPVRDWFTAEAVDILETITENPYIKSRFDMLGVERLWSDHVEGKRDNARKIYAFLMLAIWYNVFIERK